MRGPTGRKRSEAPLCKRRRLLIHLTILDPRRMVTRMDIDLTDKQAVYAAIIATEGNSKAAYSLATLIASNAIRANANSQGLRIPEELQARLDLLTAEASNEDLRAGARALFSWKMKTGQLRDQDMKQLIDSRDEEEDDELRILLVDFAQGLAQHPLPGLPADMVEQLRDCSWSELLPPRTARPGSNPKLITDEAEETPQGA